MKHLLSALISISLLFTLLPAKAQQVKGQCFDIPEETPSDTKVIRKFPKFNLQMELPENTNAVILTNGSILIVDRGTYKYLQCLQNNPRALGRHVIGYLISKPKDVKNLLAKGSMKGYRFLMYTPDYSYIALRLIYKDKATTDITVFEKFKGEEKETMDLLYDLSQKVDLIVK